MLENEGGNRAIPSRAKAIAKPEARSRVSNGKDLFLLCASEGSPPMSLVSWERMSR